MSTCIDFHVISVLHFSYCDKIISFVILNYKGISKTNLCWHVFIIRIASVIRMQYIYFIKKLRYYINPLPGRLVNLTAKFSLTSYRGAPFANVSFHLE